MLLERLVFRSRFASRLQAYAYNIMFLVLWRQRKCEKRRGKLQKLLSHSEFHLHFNLGCVRGSSFLLVACDNCRADFSCTQWFTNKNQKKKRQKIYLPFKCNKSFATTEQFLNGCGDNTIWIKLVLFWAKKHTEIESQ